MAFQGTSYSFSQRAQITIPKTGGNNSCVMPARAGTNYYGAANNYNPFVAYIGIDTDILFFIISENRRPVSLVNKTFKARISSRTTNQILITKNLTVIDYTNSVIQLRLTKVDMSKLFAGLFDLTITYTDSEGNEFALASNTAQFQITYTLEVKQQSGLQIVSSLVEDSFSNTGNIGDKLKSTAQSLNSDGTNTAVAYTTNFSGKLYAEATLETSPQESDWFELQLDPESSNNYWTFSNASGLEVWTFDGMFQWIRFRYVADSGNTGTLDKVLYRA